MPGHSLVAKNEPFKEMSANERLVDAIKPAAALKTARSGGTFLIVSSGAGHRPASGGETSHEHAGNEKMSR